MRTACSHKMTLRIPAPSSGWDAPSMPRRVQLVGAPVTRASNGRHYYRAPQLGRLSCSAVSYVIRTRRGRCGRAALPSASSPSRTMTSRRNRPTVSFAPAPMIIHHGCLPDVTILRDTPREYLHGYSWVVCFTRDPSGNHNSLGWKLLQASQCNGDEAAETLRSSPRQPPR